MIINRSLFLVLLWMILRYLNRTSASDLSLPTINVENTQWNDKWEDILKRDLLVNYDKNSRPISSDGLSQTEVIINLSLKHIDLNELKGIVHLYGWMRMVWRDEKLQWNISEFGGHEIICLSGHDIWQPNIVVYSKSTENDIDNFGNRIVMVDSKGTVEWSIPFQANFFCELDFRFWPFDTQKCTLILGSWTINDTEILLKPLNSSAGAGEAQIQPYIENNDWVVKNISILSKMREYSSAIKYELVLERRSPMYNTLVITPAACIVILTLACFWLPPKSEEKILLNSVNLICTTMFLIYFNHMLPTLAINTPVIVLFYSNALLLVGISTIVSILGLFISAMHNRKAPLFLNKIFADRLFGRILCLPNFSRTLMQLNKDTEMHHQDQNFEIREMDDDQQVIINHDNSQKTVNHDWIILAMAIDRICFIIYFIVYIIIAVLYSV